MPDLFQVLHQSCYFRETISDIFVKIPKLPQHSNCSGSAPITVAMHFCPFALVASTCFRLAPTSPAGEELKKSNTSARFKGKNVSVLTCSCCFSKLLSLKSNWASIPKSSWPCASRKNVVRRRNACERVSIISARDVTPVWFGFASCCTSVCVLSVNYTNVQSYRRSLQNLTSFFSESGPNIPPVMSGPV